VLVLVQVAALLLVLVGLPQPAGPLPTSLARYRCAVCLPFRAAGVEYGSRNVLADPEIRDGVKAFTAWPTIPQVRHLHPATFTLPAPPHSCLLASDARSCNS
jgi:hypothetical protein